MEAPKIDETPEITKRAEFRALVEPLMEWMYLNSHPHATIVITCCDAELLEGVIGVSRLPKTIPPNEDVFNTLANAVRL